MPDLYAPAGSSDLLGLVLAEVAPAISLHVLDSLLQAELSVASLLEGRRLFRACWALLQARDSLPALPAPS